MIYLITDTHFNHTKLVDLGIRQVGDEELLYQALERIPEDSWLIHLGDVSFGHDQETHVVVTTICHARHKVLIRGNHDSRAFDWYLRHGWDHACDGLLLTRYGKTTLLTHRPRDLPEWIDVNIHGHLHLNHREDPYKDDRHILLAVEATNYQAVTLKEVLRWR